MALGMVGKVTMALEKVTMGLEGATTLRKVTTAPWILFISAATFAIEPFCFDILRYMLNVDLKCTIPGVNDHEEVDGKVAELPQAPIHNLDGL